jgi:hypothetical protein
MMTFLVAASSPRLAVAADRFAEACLLQALRTRARDLDLARAAADDAAANVRLMQRALLHTDLLECFGVSTLSLLHATVVDGRDPVVDDARLLLAYRFPYELRPDRSDRLWVLTLLDADAEPAYGMASRKASPLMTSWSMATRGEDAVTELWCVIADLAAMYLAADH